jgi:hypothetical protein
MDTRENGNELSVSLKKVQISTTKRKLDFKKGSLAQNQLPT